MWTINEKVKKVLNVIAYLKKRQMTKALLNENIGFC